MWKPLDCMLIPKSGKYGNTFLEISLISYSSLIKLIFG